MKLKTTEIDGKTYALVQDGQPVYVHDDGKEAPFDAAGTVATIRARNAEAKTNRERAETAEAALKAFEGIDAVGKDIEEKCGNHRQVTGGSRRADSEVTGMRFIARALRVPWCADLIDRVRHMAAVAEDVRAERAKADAG